MFVTMLSACAAAAGRGTATCMWRRSATIRAAGACSITNNEAAGQQAGNSKPQQQQQKVRLSRIVATYGTNMQMSRRSAERMIIDGLVTFAGDTVTDPSLPLSLMDASSGVIKVAGRRLTLPENNVEVSRGVGASDRATDTMGGTSFSCNGSRNKRTGTTNPGAVHTRVWLAHKLTGELVAENDPHGRPSILDRLRRGGVGKPKKKSQRRVHLKPIGRLDMMTEGLLILTNDGSYARQMELPDNQFHRTYRARVHGRLTESKMKAIRNGVTINDTQYGGMGVKIEKAPARRERAANTWIRITCSEGKNRQIRKVFDHLGLKVTRLIRTSYGDYDLNTIPPGMAIEVPVKPLDKQKKKGGIAARNHLAESRAVKKGAMSDKARDRATVQWVRHL